MSTAAIIAVLATGLVYRAGGLAGVLVVAVLFGVAYLQRDRLAELWRRLPGRPQAGPSNPRDAGASARARARELRTPWVRLLTACSIRTAAEAEARRYDIGAKGEEHVAALLAPLAAEGWTFLYDRRLPRGRANIDILGISPKTHQVYNLDPKVISASQPLRVAGGTRLMHGTRDITSRLDGTRHETRTINSLLSVQAESVVLVLGALQPGARLRVAGVQLVPAADACTVLRDLDRRKLPRQRGPHFVDLAARLLPSYTRK